MQRQNNFISLVLLLALFFFPGLTTVGQERGDTVVVATEDTQLSTDSSDSSVLSHIEAAAADSFSLRTLPDTTVQRWKKDRLFAYANDPDYWRKEVRETPKQNKFLLWLLTLLTSDGFRYFLYIGLGVALVYFIFRVMKENNLRLFYRSGKKKGATGDVPTADELEEDLDQRLHQYVQAKDYRQATRYLYLITLRLLDQRGFIQWHQETTNRQYLQQLSGSPLADPFRYLTGIYEKVWYGEFPLAETQFTRLSRYFEDFYKTVPA